MSQRPIQINQIEDITVNDISATGTASDTTYLRGDGSWATPASGSGGISELSDDTTPQLGGNLDLNSHTVGDATAADLTKLHGLTSTATELNYTDGVTSAIQTQLDGKADSGDVPTTFDDLSDGSTNVAFTTTLKSKLDAIESGAEANDVDSVNGQTGTVTLDIDDVAPTQTGNSGKVLTTDGTNATWQTSAGGASDLDDLSDVSTSGASDGDVLTYDSDTSSWGPAASSGGMTNPMTTEGDIIYGGSSGTPTRLAKGTAGQMLAMNSGATAPEWVDASGGGGGGSSEIIDEQHYFRQPMPTDGDILLTGSAPSPTYDSGLYIQTNGTSQVVTVGKIGSGFPYVDAWNRKLSGRVVFSRVQTPYSLNDWVVRFGADSNSLSHTTVKTVGFRHNSSSMCASSCNGTAETISAFTPAESYDANEIMILSAIFTPATNVKYYDGSTLVATITTNLPSGSGSWVCTHVKFIFSSGVSSTSRNKLNSMEVWS